MHESTEYGHPERAFFQKPKLLGLGWQIGLKFIEAFVVFSVELFWHCELYVFGSTSIWLFFLQNCGFQA